MSYASVKVLILSLFVAVSVNAQSSLSQQIAALCSDDAGIEELPTLERGRVKPLMVAASENLTFLTGSSKTESYSATTLFCLLSFSSSQASELATPDIDLKVEHEAVRSVLGIAPVGKKAAASVVLAHKEQLRMQWRKQVEGSGAYRAFEQTLQRLALYEKIKAGESWKVPVKSDNEWKWPSIVKTSEYAQGSIQGALENRAKVYREKADHALDEEVYYHRVKPFTWSLLLCLIALLVAILSPKMLFSQVACSSVVLLQLVGVFWRVSISGRAPITNMYETVMFSGLGALVLAMVLGSLKRDKAFLLGGLAYNFLCLMMMKFATGMLDPTIAPLVPVLRDNFWLSTHVTTVILSYAALALSWILANVVLFKNMLGKQKISEQKKATDLIYTCQKIGVVLLSAGIILGGVWADYSWGRFWGWDPKEVGSLVALLVYLALLHARYTGWVGLKNFVPLTALAFLSVMMAWFGVNYILAAGLHTYGFSEGGAIFLGSFTVAQLAIVGLYYTVKSRALTAH